jgi:hypothetical protein
VEQVPEHQNDQNVSIFTPLLHEGHQFQAPSLPRSKGYCQNLKKVVKEYLKEHPVIFLLQILVIVALSVSIEYMAGGICVFRHGKMNIEDFTEQSYFLLAGSSLRIST